MFFWPKKVSRFQLKIRFQNGKTVEKNRYILFRRWNLEHIRSRRRFKGLTELLGQKLRLPHGEKMTWADLGAELPAVPIRLEHGHLGLDRAFEMEEKENFWPRCAVSKGTRVRGNRGVGNRVQCTKKVLKCNYVVLTDSRGLPCSSSRRSFRRVDKLKGDSEKIQPNRLFNFNYYVYVCAAVLPMVQEVNWAKGRSPQRPIFPTLRVIVAAAHASILLKLLVFSELSLLFWH